MTVKEVTDGSDICTHTHNTLSWLAWYERSISWIVVLQEEEIRIWCVSILLALLSVHNKEGVMNLRGRKLLCPHPIIYQRNFSLCNTEILVGRPQRPHAWVTQMCVCQHLLWMANFHTECTMHGYILGEVGTHTAYCRISWWNIWQVSFVCTSGVTIRLLMYNRGQVWRHNCTSSCVSGYVLRY